MLILFLPALEPEGQNHVPLLAPGWPLRPWPWVISLINNIYIYLQIFFFKSSGDRLSVVTELVTEKSTHELLERSNLAHYVGVLSEPWFSTVPRLSSQRAADSFHSPLSLSSLCWCAGLWEQCGYSYSYTWLDVPEVSSDSMLTM